MVDGMDYAIGGALEDVVSTWAKFEWEVNLRY